MTAVRDHIPLEQGLRHIRAQPSTMWSRVRDHIPLEQGLRRFRALIHGDVLFFVRDHIPLEQGLRRHFQ